MHTCAIIQIGRCKEIGKILGDTPKTAPVVHDRLDYESSLWSNSFDNISNHLRDTAAKHRPTHMGTVAVGIICLPISTQTVQVRDVGILERRMTALKLAFVKTGVRNCDDLPTPFKLSFVDGNMCI